MEIWKFRSLCAYKLTMYTVYPLHSTIINFVCIINDSFLPWLVYKLRFSLYLSLSLSLSLCVFSSSVWHGVADSARPGPDQQERGRLDQGQHTRTLQRRRNGKDRQHNILFPLTVNGNDRQTNMHIYTTDTRSRLSPNEIYLFPFT